MNPDDDDLPFDDHLAGVDGKVKKMADSETEYVDIHEYEDQIMVVADIPGVEETDVELECDGRKLAIHVSNDSRPFMMQVDLPTYVDDQSTNLRVNNGILEINLDRKPDPANIGFH